MFNNPTLRNNQAGWWGVVDGMRDLVRGEVGGDDAVDGEGGEEAVEALSAVGGAHEVFVAEEGVAIVGFGGGLDCLYPAYADANFHGVVAARARVSSWLLQKAVCGYFFGPMTLRLLAFEPESMILG